MANIKNYIANLASKAKYPLIYAGSFATLTGIVEGTRTAIQQEATSGLLAAAETTIDNLPFFVLVNIAYAKAVDMATTKGRVWANVLCLGVNAGFAAYAYYTSDNDPALQVTATTIVGLYLTNKQVSDTQLE